MTIGLDFRARDARCLDKGSQMRRRKLFALLGTARFYAASFFVACMGCLAAADAQAQPATVYFASGDGTTQLVGYVFAPLNSGPHPAVVMLHGRAGALFCQYQ
jgi:poly(3-hydroxybutyrate) depolymerase